MLGRGLEENRESWPSCQRHHGETLHYKRLIELMLLEIA